MQPYISGYREFFIGFRFWNLRLINQKRNPKFLQAALLHQPRLPLGIAAICSRSGHRGEGLLASSS